MDIATILGLLVALAAMCLSIWADDIAAGNGVPIETAYPYYNLPSLAVVFGGSLAAVLICFPLTKIGGTFR